MIQGRESLSINDAYNRDITRDYNIGEAFVVDRLGIISLPSNPWQSCLQSHVIHGPWYRTDSQPDYALDCHSMMMIGEDGLPHVANE